MNTRHLLALALTFALPFSALAESEGSARYTIDELRSIVTSEALVTEAKTLRESLEAERVKAIAADDDGKEDDIEDLLEVVEHAEEWLKRALNGNLSASERFQANAYSDRILQTAVDPVSGQYLPGYHILFKNIFLGAAIGQPVHNIPRWKRDRPIGRRKAKKEAATLYDETQADFYQVEDLARLSPEEIAALDVSPADATWFDRESFAKLQPDPVGHFEAFLIDGMTAALHEDDDLKKERRYDPAAARKVLFLEDIYASATSPKGTTEDAFGVEWKIKWGDEPAMEPVASRLYVLAGGKMTDFTYTTGTGPSDCVLILRDPEDPKPSTDDEHYPSSVEALKANVFAFYEFDLAPYIHSHGTITPENADRILANLPDGGKKKYRAEKLLGRSWVAFREANVELKTKGFVRRHDGSRMSDILAVNDRAVRGLYLFDLWIGNRDVKDDNNKAFFIKAPNDSGDLKISEYREGHHDLGLSLGSLWSSGEVNQFPVGRQFARKGLFGKLRFPQATLFRPEAWDVATWADGKWMARNIVRISDEQIVGAVESSGWPDFAQAALTWKLIERRNRIAKLYDIPVPSPSLPAPSMRVDLGDERAIRKVESHYQLPQGTLAKELASIGAGRGYAETVLVKGQIADCEHSALIRVLINERYPSGLDTRYARRNKTPPKCLDEKENDG